MKTKKLHMRKAHMPMPAALKAPPLPRPHMPKMGATHLPKMGGAKGGGAPMPGPNEFNADQEKAMRGGGMPVGPDAASPPMPSGGAPSTPGEPDGDEMGGGMG
jgi:hypothetical protein